MKASVDGRALAWPLSSIKKTRIYYRYTNLEGVTRGLGQTRRRLIGRVAGRCSQTRPLPSPRARPASCGRGGRRGRSRGSRRRQRRRRPCSRRGSRAPSWPGKSGLQEEDRPRSAAFTGADESARVRLGRTVGERVDSVDGGAADTDDDGPLGRARRQVGHPGDQDRPCSVGEP